VLEDPPQPENCSTPYGTNTDMPIVIKMTTLRKPPPVNGGRNKAAKQFDTQSPIRKLKPNGSVWFDHKIGTECQRSDCYVSQPTKGWKDDIGPTGQAHEPLIT